jgi:hypothetical protein
MIINATSIYELHDYSRKKNPTNLFIAVVPRIVLRCDINFRPGPGRNKPRFGLQLSDDDLYSAAMTLHAVDCSVTRQKRLDIIAIIYSRALFTGRKFSH